MSLAEIGLAGQPVGLLDGGDGQPAVRLLSVAEIQHAFRELQQRPHRARLYPAASGHIGAADPRPHTGDPTLAPATTPHIPSVLDEWSPHAPATDDHAVRPHTVQKPNEATPASGRLERDWIAVVAAHGGAGASCVALAVTDALARVQRPVRLIEAAHPVRSGLVASAHAELGTDPTGGWRRGSRHLATLYRRASGTTPENWPAPVGSSPVITVVDLGLATGHTVSRLAADQPTVVLVCRVSVPGVRFAEQLLGELDETPLVLAAVGPSRWPGPITATLGPRLRQLRGNGRIITIPADRRLQLIGPSIDPLPRPIAAAGRALLELLDSTHPAGLSQSASPPAWSAARRRGFTR